MTLKDFKNSVDGFNEDADMKMYSSDFGIININGVSYRVRINPETKEIIHEVIVE